MVSDSSDYCVLSKHDPVILKWFGASQGCNDFEHHGIVFRNYSIITHRTLITVYTFPPSKKKIITGWAKINLKPLFLYLQQTNPFPFFQYLYLFYFMSFNQSSPTNYDLIFSSSIRLLR